MTFAFGGRVIPAERFGQVTEAAEILEAARQAAAKAEAERDAARQQAWREGYDDGFAQGIRDATERLVTALGRAESELFNLEGPIEAIVIKSFGVILGSMDANERTGKIIRQAISQETESRWIVIHSPPEDEKAIRQVLAGLDERISLKIDPLMASREMVIETASGRSHIGVADQVCAMIEAFRND